MTRIDDRELNLRLWVAQWVLAAAFHFLGLVKALVPAGDVQQGLGLVTQAPGVVLGPVGIVELVGSLGVVLPSATGLFPRLSPIAAGCLAGVALLGAFVPATGGGFALPLPNLILAAAGAFVAWGRIAGVPVVPLGLQDRESDLEVEAALRLLAKRQQAHGVPQERRVGQKNVA